MNPKQKVAAVLLAAGRSRRMGGGENKVLRLLGDRPALAYSMQAFQRSPIVSSVVIAGRSEDFPTINELIHEYCPKAEGRFVEGGAERFNSVLNGLEACFELHPDAVLIHDSARPFLEESFILSSLEALDEKTGGVIGVPLKDTLKETDRSGFVVQTHERDRFWLSQTPQTFRYSEILEAYRSCNPPPYPTDDGAVLEMQGGRIKMVQGSYLNMKLTTPEDWMLAEAILRLQQDAR